jgi:hypothetical protein
MENAAGADHAVQVYDDVRDLAASVGATEHDACGVAGLY